MFVVCGTFLLSISQQKMAYIVSVLLVFVGKILAQHIHRRTTEIKLIMTSSGRSDKFNLLLGL